MLVARSSVISSLVSRHAHVSSVLIGCRSFQAPAYRRRMNKKKKKQKNGSIGINTPMDMAMSCPHDLQEADNSILLTLAAMENHSARIEVLKRHIMCTENCSYEQATSIFHKIQTSNRRWQGVASLPYLVSIGVSTTAGLCAIPLCFHSPTVHHFNEKYVTMCVPDDHELETVLELGTWAWNWMEPPLGTISFLLLCLQFSR